jgi:YbbR domain-containing protein
VLTVPLHAGDYKLNVTTDQLCQGEYDALIHVPGPITPFPVPFVDQLQINLGTRTAKTGVFTVCGLNDGKSLYSKQMSQPSGIITLDLSTLQEGVYVMHVTLDGRDEVLKIVKK